MSELKYLIEQREWYEQLIAEDAALQSQPTVHEPHPWCGDPIAPIGVTIAHNRSQLDKINKQIGALIPN